MDIIAFESCLWQVVCALIQALVGWIAADLITATLHWLEDSYGRPTTPLVGGFIERNIAHHIRPHESKYASVSVSAYTCAVYTNFVISLWSFVVATKPLLTTVNSTLAPAMLFWAASTYFGWMPVAFASTLALGTGYANALHALSHRWPQDQQSGIPWIYRALVAVGLAHSYADHKLHHTPPFVVACEYKFVLVRKCAICCYFCVSSKNRADGVLCPRMNGLYEAIRLWRTLEAGIELATGVPPRLRDNE